MPSKGHDSRRAEYRDYTKNQRLSEMTEVVGGLQYTRLNSVPYVSSVLRESDLFLEPVHLPSANCSTLARDHAIKISRNSQNGEFMAILLAILDFLFGCHHVHLSRVFTLQGETYRVCCDCGAKFAYSLETMSIEHRLPLTPVLTRFRIA